MAHEVRRALVIKLRHHGDVLLTSPVLTELKTRYPDAEIDALVYHDTREMLSGHPALAQLHTIGRDWRTLNPFTQLARWWPLLRTLKARDYDLIVHLTDHWHGARLVRWLKPKVSVAPMVDRGGRWAQKAWKKSFSHLFPVLRGNTRHTVEMHLDALRRIGIQPRTKALGFVPGEQASDSVRGRLAQAGVAEGRFILIHPTSRWLFKTWPVAQMAALVDALTARGEQVVLSAAPAKAELDWVAQLNACLTRPVALDLSGQLSLKELGALIGAARAFVGVDSVPMHLAAALQTPTVALFGPSGDIEWGPWHVPHRLLTTAVACRPCGRDGCGGSKVSDCLTAIAPERVLAALDELLAETAGAVQEKEKRP
ncbi:putative lipopolysaccharide heptosyltransferase III [Chitinibacteraceae bacterium HSL-7]